MFCIKKYLNSNLLITLYPGEESVRCKSDGSLHISPLTRCIPRSCDLFSVENGDVVIDDVILGSRAQVSLLCFSLH